jgi:hypothetical protein
MANIISEEYSFQTDWNDPFGQTQKKVKITNYDDGTQTITDTGESFANNSTEVQGTKSGAELQGIGTGGGAGSSGAAGSTYGGPGPGYMKPEGWVDPVEATAPEPAPSFAPKGVADYSAQNKLESSLKSALKQKTGKNVEYGMRLAPKPSSGGMLSSFK